MTFRLTNLFYVFALVAASLSASGPAGLFIVVGVLLFWNTVLAKPYAGWTSVAVAGGILVILILMLAPAVEMARSGAQHAGCRNNMRQMALAIYNYHDCFDQLPPAAGPKGKNNDLHSWRMLVVPFVESGTLYDRYSFDEPWNGPANRRLIGNLPIHFYECPTHSNPTETNYFAITGSQTAWGDGEPRGFEDISDGTSATILLVEAPDRGVHWAEPKDLTFDEAVQLLTTPLPASGGNGHRVEHGYFYKPSYVRNVAMCDGYVHPLRVPVPRDAAIALLTASGGEEIDSAWLERQSNPELDYGRVWVATLFVVLAILPGMPTVRPWVWPQITNSTTRAEASPLGPNSSPLEE